MRTSASIVLLPGICLLSVAWITSWLLLSRHIGGDPFLESTTTMLLDSSFSSLASGITWIGSVWIPPPEMIMYSTPEIQDILSRYDSILWLGDKVSPFATLFHLLRHSNTTAYLSRRTSTDEVTVMNSTASCPLWMDNVNNMTAQPSFCHSIPPRPTLLSSSVENSNQHRHVQQQRLDFVTAKCLSHLKQALSDWYSALLSPLSSSSSSSSSSRATGSSVGKQQQQQQQILVIISLGCDDVSHKARRRHACETPRTRQFPMGVWKRLDLVVQQLHDMITNSTGSLSSSSSSSLFSSSSSASSSSSSSFLPIQFTIVWKLGNYCQAHPERDGHVEEMDRRIRRGIMTTQQQLAVQQQHPHKQTKRHSRTDWNIFPIDHGLAIRPTVHVLNADTRLEHTFVFLQLLANYLEQQQQQQQDKKEEERKQQ